MIYLIAWDIETDQRVSARVPKRSDADYLKQSLPHLNLIETGAVSYWLMSHGFPKLSMMPFFY